MVSLDMIQSVYLPYDRSILFFLLKEKDDKYILAIKFFGVISNAAGLI